MRIVVAEGATGVFGFYSTDGEPPSGELGNVWVVPEQIGTGLGRELWQHALANARRAGFTSLRVARTRTRQASTARWALSRSARWHQVPWLAELCRCCWSICRTRW
jgi:GNAT superfamily N-acetyltransferase